MTTYPFVKARWFTSANRGKGDIKFLVFHDMEMAEKPTTAESCANYFATTTTQASSHYTIDNDSIVQCVLDKDVAWCAPGANSNGLHFEHAGFASQTRADWLDPFGVAMLTRSAALFAEKCRQYGIAPRKGDASDILAGRPCIVGHWDITKAYPDKGSHTDPGANFPWDYFIGLVQAAYNGTTNTAGGFLMALTDQQQNDLYALMVETNKRVMGGIPDGKASGRKDSLGRPTRILDTADGETILGKTAFDPASVAASLVALLPTGVGVTDAQLEAALRKVLGSVDGVSA